MVLTLAQKQAAMQHIIRNVMGQQPDSPIEKSFRDANYEDPADIHGMDEEAIQELAHTNVVAGADGAQTITHHDLTAGYKGRV